MCLINPKPPRRVFCSAATSALESCSRNLWGHEIMTVGTRPIHGNPYLPYLEAYKPKIPPKQITPNTCYTYIFRCLCAHWQPKTCLPVEKILRFLRIRCFTLPMMTLQLVSQNDSNLLSGGEKVAVIRLIFFSSKTHPKYL